MANKAYQRIYTKLEAITKATVSLKAKGVSNDELAVVGGKLAQVVMYQYFVCYSGSYQVLGNVACSVCSTTVYLAGVFS